MQSAGLWMLLAAAALMISTGLPVWMLLSAVAMIFAAIGVAVGVFPFAVLSSLPSRLLGLLDNDLLQALPLYVLMGALLNRLPLAETMFRVGQRAFRRTGAGAPLAGLALGILLAPMNGSVGASVSMLSRTVAPRLAAAGVESTRAAALIAMASTLGVVIPPSLVLILLGDAMLRAHTEAVNATHAAVQIINTRDVFRGALVPAAILLSLVAVAVWLINRRSVPAEKTSPSLRRVDILIALVTVAFIAGLLGGVIAGALYAVEAAATGGVALFVFGMVTGTLTRTVLIEVLRDTLALTGALFALLIGATCFTLVLRAFGSDLWIAQLLTGLPGGPATTIVVGLAVIAICALVLDAFEMIFVVIPVVLPPLLIAEPDAVWVAVLVLLVLQASFLFPPFGYAVLMVRNALGHQLSMRKFAQAVAPYLALQLVVLLLVAAVPMLAWRSAVEATNGATPLTDDEARQLMQQQLDEQSPPPTDPK